jgi:hypothetical protein
VRLQAQLLLLLLGCMLLLLLLVLLLGQEPGDRAGRCGWWRRSGCRGRIVLPPPMLRSTC